MLLLTTTTDLLQVITGSALSTNVVASFVDITTSTFTPGSQQTNITTAATTTIVAAPAASTQRQIKMISVVNAGASAQTVTIQKSSSSTAYNVTGAITLQTGEVLYYQDGIGFSVRDINGQIKETNTTLLTSSYVGYGSSAGLLTGSSTLTYTLSGSVSTLSVGNAQVYGDGTNTYLSNSVSTGSTFIGTYSHPSAVTISNSGNITIAATPSGTALTVDQESSGTQGILNYGNFNGSTRITVQNVTSGSAATADLELSTGTTNAYALLQVIDNTGSPYINLTGGSGIAGAYFGINGHVALQYSQAGNVSIPAPSSGTTLSVIQQGSSGVPLLLSQTGATTNGQGQIQFDTNGNMYFETNFNNTSINIGGYNSNNSLNFITGSTRMTIGASGNITVNAPSSGLALTVNGVSSANGMQINNTGAGAGLYVNNSTSATGVSVVGPSGSAVNGISFGQSGQTTWTIFQPASSSNFQIEGGSQTFLTLVAGSGNLLLGTTTDLFSAAASLNVNNGSLYFGSGGGNLSSIASNMYYNNAAWRYAGNGYGMYQKFNVDGAGSYGIVMFGYNSSGAGVSGGTGQQAFTIAQSGSISVAAPISGTALTVNGASSNYALNVQGAGGQYAAVIAGNGSTGSSDGLIIYAGTNGGDFPFVVANKSGTSMMTINGAGNVVINSPTSGNTMTVNGLAGYIGLVVQGSTTSSVSQGLWVYGGTNSNDSCAQFRNASGGTIFMNIQGNGNVNLSSLGTGTVYSNGGSLTNTNPSDERLKDNIQDTKYGLADVIKLRPVTFNWKNNPTNQATQFGFIAQEVQDVIPEAIAKFDRDGETYLGLEKDAIYGALVNAVKEQQQQIEELKLIVAALAANKKYD